MIWKYFRLLKSLSSQSEALIRLVYPAFCALCGRSLTLEERSVCGVCREKLKMLELPRHEAHKIFTGQSLKEYFSVYSYKDELKTLWTQVKFQRRAWLTAALNTPLQKFLLAVQPETRYDYLSPVPTTLRRRLERHYNQADLLASQISAFSGIPVIRALKKRFSTSAQRQLSREDRQSNLRKSFAACGPLEKVRGRSILLVDDIFTTGATARECAQVLKQAGAKRIGIWTLAQTPEHLKSKNGNNQNL